MKAIKVGMRVNVTGSGFDGSETSERATIMPWLKTSGPRSELPGYHRVKFAAGGSMLVHESRMVAP